MKKYYVINGQNEMIAAQDYLKNSGVDAGFAEFVKCESGEKSKSAEKSSDYLEYCRKFGFNWEENGDAGFVQYDYKANFIMRVMKEYARSLVDKIGFPVYEVRGSNVFDLSHPVVEAYAKLYGDRLFQFRSGDRNVVMSYDASYPQFNLAAKMNLSYKNLPFAHFSISDCYRHEQSGECMMLYRDRRFFMPDLHPYFADVNQAFEWYPKIEAVIIQAAKSVNREYFMSIEVASQECLDKYREDIMKIAGRHGKEVLCIVHDDSKSRYWIINNDYKIVDKLGQSREIACIQIDMGNAKRLGINYADVSGEQKEVAIIHAAVPGGIERFIYMVLDNYKESMPIWLHPIQIRLLPVSEKFVGLAGELMIKYEKLGVRIDVDDRNESVGKRLKMAREELIPNAIVIGEKEENGAGNIEILENLVKEIIEKSHEKPFIPISWPKLCSKKI